MLRSLLLGCVMWTGAVLAAPAGPAFAVVPSSIQPPAGVPLGSFRRSYQPFENWTLICDENLAAGRRICNIRQEIGIVGAGTIFSWAMVATDSGEERMLITAPAAIGQGGAIELTFNDGQGYIARVACDEAACTATVPVGPRMRRHIAEELNVGIRFSAPPVGTVEFKAPMNGLKDALRVVGK